MRNGIEVTDFYPPENGSARSAQLLYPSACYDELSFARNGCIFERETDKKGEMRKKKKQKSFGKKQDLGQHTGEGDDICENPQNRSNLERMAGV